MRIGILRTEKDYDAAMKRLSELMAEDPPPGSREVEELELLGLLIAEYERGIVPPPKVDPVEAILFRMEQQGLTRKDLVPYIGSAPRVSEVLSRRRPLSIAMIRRLHKGLGIPADVLIGPVDEEGPVCAEREVPNQRRTAPRAKRPCRSRRS